MKLQNLIIRTKNLGGTNVHNKQTPTFAEIEYYVTEYEINCVI